MGALCRRSIGASVALAAGTLLAAPAVASGATTEIAVQDNFYSPSQVAVTLGDTVRWTFADNESTHTVTLVSPSGPPAVVDEVVEPDDPPLDYVPPLAGRYVLLCQIHSPMRGRVDVLATSEPSPPVTTALLNDATPSINAYAAPVSLSLEASDDSGVDITRYRTEDGTTTSYTSPISFSAPGLRTIEYRSLDIAGNEEPWQSVSFTIEAPVGPPLPVPDPIPEPVIESSLRIDAPRPIKSGALAKGVLVDVACAGTGPGTAELEAGAKLARTLDLPRRSILAEGPLLGCPAGASATSVKLKARRKTRRALAGLEGTFGARLRISAPGTDGEVEAGAAVKIVGVKSGRDRGSSAVQGSA